MLNSNPVVVAKHFQFRLERLFKDLILSTSNPIGKVQYYAIRIEFQFRGSPYAHCFIWVKDFPLLTEETTDSFVEFIDHHVQAYLPDPISEPELHQLVKCTKVMHTQRLVEDIKTFLADLMLVISSQTEQL